MEWSLFELYTLILIAIFKIKSVPNRDKVKGKRHKVAFSHVLFLMLFINPGINI